MKNTMLAIFYTGIYEKLYYIYRMIKTHINSITVSTGSFPGMYYLLLHRQTPNIVSTPQYFLSKKFLLDLEGN